MARKAGRNSRLFVAVASNGTPSPIPGLAAVSFDASTDRSEVTAMGDSNKQYVGGLPDFSGDYSGFYDDASAQLYSAAVDGVPRAFYFYPDFTDTTRYAFGTAFFDFKMATGVGDAVAVSGTFQAASNVLRSAAWV